MDDKERDAAKAAETANDAHTDAHTEEAQIRERQADEAREKADKE